MSDFEYKKNTGAIAAPFEAVGWVYQHYNRKILLLCEF